MKSGDIKILIAHFRDDVIGGAEIAIADMVDMRSPIFHYIMLVPGKRALADFYHDRGYDVWTKRIQTKRRKYPGLHTVQSWLFSKWLVKEKINIVLSNDTPAASRVRTACRMAGVPHAVYVRTQLSDKPIHRRLLCSAQKVLAVSQAVKCQIQPMCRDGSVVLAYDHFNAAPIVDRINAHRARAKRLLPFPESIPVVGIIGRLQRIKQQDLFLRAAHLVLHHGCEARFVIVGSTSQNETYYEEELRCIAKELGLKDRVVFMGFRPDAVEIMSELSITCIASSQEGFPRTLLEAQSIGCPVISADIGGCPEMVEDGATGLLFSSTRPDSPELLAENIIRLLADEALRKRLAANAKARLMQTFASSLPVRQFEAHLRSLIR